jgi:hypothetical protein
VHAFLPSHSSLFAYDEELERKAELAALEKAKGGVGETAAGAILGGLLLGPFGAVFGASIGSNLGARNALSNAKKQELERMGVTEEMLQSAKEIGASLDRGFEGLKIIQDSLQTQQSFASKLDSEVQQVYAKAKAALEEGDEDRARDLLFKRSQLQEKLKKTLQNCIDEKRRLSQMEDNVRALEERALEMESLLKRNIGEYYTVVCLHNLNVSETNSSNSYILHFKQEPRL